MDSKGLVTPIYPCSSVSATVDFYRGLGLEVTEYETANSCTVEFPEKTNVYFRIKPSEVPYEEEIRVHDLRELLEALSPFGLHSSGIPRLSSVVDEWGQVREVSLVDPDGNTLRFTRFFYRYRLE